MKIIGTVVLVLIAGILRSANARFRTHAARSRCIDNTGPKQDLENCYSPVLREMQGALNVTGGADAVIELWCNNTEIFDSCLRSYGRSSKLCLGPDSYQVIDLIVNVSTSALGFPCANPQLMKDVYHVPGAGCMRSKVEAVMNCGRRVLTDYDTMIADNQVSGFNRYELDTGFYNNRMCGNILASQNCGVKVLEECEDKRFSQLLDSLHKYINNDIPCDNLPKSPKSESSTSGSVVIAE